MHPRRGLTLIELIVVVSVIAALIALLLPAVQSAREASRRARCQANLKQIGLALASYQAATGVYPFGVGGGAAPPHGPRWSAASQLLLHLEQANLYHALNFSCLPWPHDPVLGPPNSTALTTSLAVLLCPSDSDTIGDEIERIGHNSYRGNAGTFPYNLENDSGEALGRNNGAFWYQSAIKPSDVADGSSTTAFFSERCLGTPNAPDLLADYYRTAPLVDSCLLATPGITPRFTIRVEWSGQRWSDGDLFYTRYNHILPPLGPSCMFGEKDDQTQMIVTATSRHPGGVNLLMGDGSARFIKRSVNGAIWSALGTINGSEVVGGSDY